MRINTNIMAINTHRQLGVNNGNQSKITEKLSSGLRINRAADDAAGLTISEKMRAQMRGLSRASSNAQDGVSLIQAAEGALSETHNILQRMRELAVQAANDVNDVADRDAIQAELNALTSEVDRIAYTTEFNKKNLLDGSLSTEKYSKMSSGINASIVSVVNDTVNVGASTLSVTAGQRMKVEFTFKEIDLSDAKATGGSITITGGANLNTTNVSGGDIPGTLANVALNAGEKYTKEDIARMVGAAITETLRTVGNDDYTVTVTGEKVTIEAKYADTSTITTASALTGASGITVKVSANLSIDGTTPLATSSVATATGTTGKSAQATLTGTNAATAADVERGIVDLGNYKFKIEDDTKESYSTVFTGQGKSLTLQVGANTGDNQTIKVGVDMLSASGLGIGNLNVANHSSSQSAVDSIEAAITKVSKQRSALGAVQNRLEHTISNLDTVNENLTNAESRVRDMDMAKGMMDFTKNNILTQAATAMLAQANSSPQTVLQLLQ